MQEAVETALESLTHWRGQDAGTPPTLEPIDSLLVRMRPLPAETLSLVARLREKETAGDKDQTSLMLAHGDRLLAQAAAVLGPAQEN